MGLSHIILVLGGPARKKELEKKFLECYFVLISKVSFYSLLLQFSFLNSLKLLLANPSSKKARNGQGHSFHIKEGDILRIYAKKKSLKIQH